MIPGTRIPRYQDIKIPDSKIPDMAGTLVHGHEVADLNDKAIIHFILDAMGDFIQAFDNLFAFVYVMKL